MSKALLLILLAGNVIFLSAQPAAVLIKRADSLEAALNETAAYAEFRTVLRVDPRNYNALWKCSELCSRIGFRQPSKEKKADYYNAARIYAETAIKVNPGAADGYYVLSLAMGRRAQMESGRDRIKAVREIRINAEKAIQINPNHGRAWHVMGKWHYEISNLNRIEKAAVKIFYGGLPKSSFKESVAAYEKAMVLLRALPPIPEKTEDDKRIKAEGKTLMEKWSK